MIKNTMVRENSSVYGGIARNWKRHSLLNCFLYELVGSNPTPFALQQGWSIIIGDFGKTHRSAKTLRNSLITQLVLE